MFSLLFAISFVAIFFYSFIKSNIKIVYFAAMSLSFWGANFGYIGLNIDLSRLFALLSLCFLIFKIKNIRLSTKQTLSILILLLMWIAPLSVGLSNAYLIPDYGYGLAQSPEVRPIVQLIQRISYLSLFLLPFILSKNNSRRFADITIKGYLVGTTIQVILGLYQVTAYKINLPLWDYGYGQLQFVNGIARVNALGGEPRHLAMFLLPSTVYLLFNLAFTKNFSLFSKNTTRLMFIGHFVVLFLTFSSTGIFLFIASFALGYFLFVSSKKLLSSLLILTLFLIGAILYINFSSQDAIQKRVIDRANMDYYQTSEYSTWAVFEYIDRNPSVIITGVGIGLPAFYIKEMPTFVNSYTRNPNLSTVLLRDPNGLSLIMLESGIMGVLFCICVFIFLIRCCKDKTDPKRSLLSLFLLAVFSTGTVGYGILSPLFFMCFGGLLASKQD